MNTGNYLKEIFGLDGSVAVVIGGTGVLCGAMAEGLAGAGAIVVIVGRSEEKARARLEQIEQLGGTASFVAAEAGERSSLDNLRTQVLERHGRVDILVNGAGINLPTPFLEVGEDEYDRIMNVNTKAVFVSCQIFGSQMVEHGGGSVINIGSMSGLIPLSRVFAYSMSKAAVHNLSKNLAREWAPSGVRVNTIVPGFFPAEQNRKLLTPDRVASIMGHTPINRFGEAKELIGTTLLLASDRAGSFITGTEIVVDGGYASMTI